MADGLVTAGLAPEKSIALPGETARVRLVEERRGFARAEIIELLKTVPERIAPRCAHFGAKTRNVARRSDLPSRFVYFLDDYSTNSIA